MKLFHTSPTKIESISKFGTFDDCLFFSIAPYSMSVGEVITYSVDASGMDFVDASDLHDDEIVERIAKVLEVDLEDAESLLDGSSSIWDFDHIEDHGEQDWWLQAKRGECAVKMGFDGCIDRDEQGSVYIIPMFGRESILVEEND